MFQMKILMAQTLFYCKVSSELVHSVHLLLICVSSFNCTHLCIKFQLIYLKIRHIFKSCNIHLKPERFCKSKFTLSKVKSE